MKRQISLARLPPRGISLYGIASTYYRLTFPVAFSLALYSYAENNIKRHVEVYIDEIFKRANGNAEDILQRLRVFGPRCEPCKVLDKILNGNAVGRVKLLLDALDKVNLVYPEPGFWEILNRLPDNGRKLISQLVTEFRGLDRLADFMQLMVGDGVGSGIFSYPPLLYQHHIKSSIRQYREAAGGPEERKAISEFETLVNEFYKLFDTLTNCVKCVMLKPVNDKGLPVAWYVAKSLGVPLTLSPPRYYLALYTDADDASEFFSGTAGNVVGLVGAVYNPVRAYMEAQRLTTGTNGSSVSAYMYPLYMAGDDYLVMAPLEDAPTLLEGFAGVLNGLGLEFSFVAAATHLHAPLREVISVISALMFDVAKRVKVLSLQAEKSTGIFTRIFADASYSASLIPLKLVDVETLLNLLRRLVAYANAGISIRVGGSTLSINAALTRLASTYLEDSVPEERLFHEYRLLRLLRTIGLEAEAMSLLKMLRSPGPGDIFIPSRMLRQNYNIGLEILYTAYLLHKSIPDTFWPDLS